MKKLVSTKGMSHDEWLQWRRKGIGGSDAATIMGVNPFACEMDLWLDKIGQFSEESESEPAYWGKLLEDVVAREYTKRTGAKVQRVNAILAHDEYDFMLANIDRKIVGQKKGLECKTTSAFNKWPWKEGDVPPYYYAQAQHYLAVTGWDEWGMAILVGGQWYIATDVYRNEDYIKDLTEKEKAFWNLVQTNTPPEFDGSDASSRVVANMYPTGDGSVKELPDEAFELIRQYDDASIAESDAQRLKDEAANKLKALIGEAEKGSIFDRTVSWSTVRSKRFDSKKFQAEQEALYKEYLNESTYRRFQIR